MKWNVSNKVDFWKKAGTHETQTFLGRDLSGWERKTTHKLLVYLIAMQRLLPAEWKSHSLQQLADTIVTWLATHVSESRATEILHDKEEKC